jgi:secreted Zn-dependent insulinase-like peptidase
MKTMLKTKFELAKKIVDQYNQAYLQGDTFLHIQEWIDEQIKKEQKSTSIKFNDE